MIDHLSFYASDFEASRKFYEAVLPRLGYEMNAQMVSTWDPQFPTRRLCAFGPGQKRCLWLIETRDAATPRHVAFVAKSRADVDAFYHAAREMGAKDNGAPGLRPSYHENYYGAFVIDPDGNNVEAVCHGPKSQIIHSECA